MQYRRGKIHWYISREVLLAKICELHSAPVPEANNRYYRDHENFRLPKTIPLDLW
ncbi:hypothetical protein [Neisseria iguanae]|uniref:hypothetical protein n=1 Tax=Neisseria iguanae TaxID=90242 RepID=UPI001FE89B49|nr:hypothetical protein [Neisseria iguanae]